jgi:hypothetical protein
VRLEKTVGSPESQEVLTTASGKAALENLLKRFVLVSADKSENNTIVVCQRHYVQRIRAELAGVEGKAHTYRVELEKIDVIVEEQLRRVTEFGVKYGFRVEKAQEKLATLYWTAKMHKNPNAERFIASSSKCVTKVLSQFLSKCLKTVQTELKFLCLRKKRESKSSWSKYWIVNSSDEVVGKIKELNMKGEASSVGSFDFSTLYTKLEHERLKAKLKWAIETAFESRAGSVLAVYKQRAKWVEKPRSETVVIDAAGLVELVEFLIDNLVIVYGEQAYRQVIGIPMGTDCAPFLANLYLFVLEYEWVSVQEQTEEGRERLRVLVLVGRYIDDLFAVNGERVLAACLLELYQGLEVKKESKTTFRSHFLDLDIVVNKGRLVLATYDKRDAFPFEVRSYPNLAGNVHGKKSHGIIVGQLRRFAQACDHWNDFSNRLKTLTGKLLEQGFDRERLRVVIGRFHKQRGLQVSKYSKSLESFVEGCFTQQAAQGKVERAGSRQRKRKRSKQKKKKGR